MRTIVVLKQARFLSVLILAAIVICCLVNASAGNRHSAIDLTDEFKVGDQVEVSVSGLEDDRYYEPCVLTEILNNGYRVKCSGIEYVVQRGWVRHPKGNAPQAKDNAEQTDAEGTPKRQAPNDDAVDQDVAQTCDYVVPRSISNAERFSVDIARRKLYDNYKLSANGGVTAPLKLGVTFLTLQIGRYYTNIARDGFRINDAAPVNATIYQVKSKHIVCEEYRDRTLRRQVESNYACFKNRDAEWACGLDGVPKIIQLR